MDKDAIRELLSELTDELRGWGNWAIEMYSDVEGSVLDAKENIIGHQVNCIGVMGAGLALQIKNKYSMVFEEYCEV